MLEVGIIGTHNALKATLAHDIGRFYLASSSEAYENPPVIPTPETVRLSVSDVFNPRYSYSGSKIAGELMTIKLLAGLRHARRDLPTARMSYRGRRLNRACDPAAREGHPRRDRGFGGRLDRDRALAGSGEETRAFIFVADGVRAIESGTLHNPEGGLIHIGNQVETRIADLAALIGRSLGVDVTIQPSAMVQGSPSRRCPDTSRLRALGFAPEVSLEEGVGRTVRWYADHYRGVATPA